MNKQLKFNPKFNGNAVMRQLIQMFPPGKVHEISHFLLSENYYLADGKRPIDLIKNNPEMVISLADAYLHPSDVF